MTRIATQLAELQELTVLELVERYRALTGREPRSKNRTWLLRRIAWRIQEAAFGGLSAVARRRIEELAAEIDLPLEVTDSVASGRQRPATPKIGTTVSRAWRGKEVRATRVVDGWECEGEIHPSLSAVARSVTGSRWSGPLFFGLRERGKKKS